MLARAGAYVVEFQRQLSGIVAEEHYVQDVRYPLATSTRVNPLLARHRELTSDLLLVKPVGADRWIQFRDVFDVDGKAVRDRNERLMQLFLAPDASSAAQVQRIADESSRYNIGNLYRTMNVPVLALVILDPVNQARFKFKRSDHHEALLEHGSTKPPERLGGRLSGGPEADDHSHHQRPRSAGARPLLDRTGDRARAHERAHRRRPHDPGIIDVELPIEPAMACWCRSRCASATTSVTTARASTARRPTARFRQFQVKVDEKLAPIVKEK